ncbi:MAG: 3-keto-disaccharide hydrolase [Burkholderiales bacterium]
MKHLSVVVSALLVIAFTAFGCAQMSSMYDSVTGAGWATLIDGEKGLENFNRVGDANWRAEDGAIVADKGKGGFLVTKKPYKDFELKVEFWADHTTNSGIFIRCQDPSKITDKSCYEANIYDDRADPSFGTGAIQHITKASPMLKAGGKWSTYEITIKGPQITVVLNGVQTATAQHSQFAQGPIALQFGNHGKAPGGVIKYRKLQIKEL